MRIVVLAPSPWSETSLALCTALADSSLIPAGVVSLPSWHWRTARRKLSQWGARRVLRYLMNKRVRRDAGSTIQNPYLEPYLERSGEPPLRSLFDASRRYGFPVHTFDDLNSTAAIEAVRGLDADVLVFTGGGIVKSGLLKASRLGVLNAHGALLPEVRGMSAPEWSLLHRVPPGITVHLMDTGIDTGPIVIRRALPGYQDAASLDDLRDALVAFGVTLLVEAVQGLARGELSPVEQPDLDVDRQHFVMHERLRELAERCLSHPRIPASAPPTAHGASNPSLAERC